MAKPPAPTSGEASPPEEGYETRPLNASTWDAFAELVERNNGVYGGCWCIAFHTEYQRGVSYPRTLKEQLVKAGRARRPSLRRRRCGAGLGPVRHPRGTRAQALPRVRERPANARGLA